MSKLLMSLPGGGHAAGQVRQYASDLWMGLHINSQFLAILKRDGVRIDLAELQGPLPFHFRTRIDGQIGVYANKASCTETQLAALHLWIGPKLKRGGSAGRTTNPNSSMISNQQRAA